MPLTTRADRVAAFRTLRGGLKSLDHPSAMAEVDRIVGWLGDPALPSSVLGWDELRRLAGEGVTLAPHSRRHPLLERIDPSELDDEIAGSRADLVREIGAAPAAFAYPSGSHSDVRRGPGRGARHPGGIHDGPGGQRPPPGRWHRLRRINVGGRSSPALIRAQALGWLAR